MKVQDNAKTYLLGLTHDAINRITTNRRNFEGYRFLKEAWFVVAQFIALCVSPVYIETTIPSSYYTLRTDEVSLKWYRTKIF